MKIKVLILTIVLATYTLPILAAPTAAEIAQQQALLQRMEQLEAAKRQEEEERNRLGAPSVKLQEEKKKTKYIELPDEEMSFFIKEIIVDYGEQTRFAWVQKKVKRYENRNIGVEGINLISTMLSDLIIEKGYVTTRVVVPEQDLTTGTLRYVIIPGLISDIRFEKPNNWGTWRTAFPTRKNKILNVRTLEQGLEQMKRVANQDVKMQLVPGENPGDSDVVISLTREKPWSIGISYDDSGIKSTGRLQSSVNLTIHNPTGLNDTLNFSFGRNGESTREDYDTKNHSFYYSIPYGNYTFNLSKYKTDYFQTVPGFTPFKSRSTMDIFEVGVQRLLHRDQKRKTQLAFKLNKKERHSFIDDTEILVQKQQTTSYQLALQHRQYAGNNTIDLVLSYQKGIPWWGAVPGMTDGIKDTATTRYQLFGINLNIAAPFKMGAVDARYTFNFRGQYSDDVLYSSENFSIGGRYSVRGFDGEQSLSAEKGFFIRNELSFPIKMKKGSMEIYTGLDYGYVTGPSDKYLLGKELIGSVFGLRGSFFPQMQYEVFVGTPIYKPKGFRTPKHTLGFQVYWQF